MPKKSPRKSRKPSRFSPRHADLQAGHRHWLAQAEQAARRPMGQGGSPHPSVKVGAVLVSRAGKKIAEAANRFAAGVDRRRPERYREGSKSLWINCAEQLAIAKALCKRADIRGASLYVTLEPCAVCAGLIGELHLKRVYVPIGAMRRYARLKPKWKDSIEIGLLKLAEAGVELAAIDTEPPHIKKKI